MDLFKILGHIYTSRNSKWIEEVYQFPSPVILIRWLGMNDKILNYVRYLDKYVYNLSPKHFTYLCWAVIPKSEKVPYVKYIKKNEEDEDIYESVLEKVRKMLDMGEKDFQYCRRFLIGGISLNKVEWFKRLGMSKDEWRKHGLKFQEMKSEGKRTGKSGLELWGI